MTVAGNSRPPVKTSVFPLLSLWISLPSPAAGSEGRWVSADASLSLSRLKSRWATKRLKLLGNLNRTRFRNPVASLGRMKFRNTEGGMSEDVCVSGEPGRFTLIVDLVLIHSFGFFLLTFMVGGDLISRTLWKQIHRLRCPELQDVSTSGILSRGITSGSYSLIKRGK